MHVVIVVEHDIWETQEWMEPKVTPPVAVWPRHLSSSGHFVMMSKGNRRNLGAQLVAHSWRERVVVHNFITSPMARGLRCPCWRESRSLRSGSRVSDLWVCHDWNNQKLLATRSRATCLRSASRRHLPSHVGAWIPVVDTHTLQHGRTIRYTFVEAVCPRRCIKPPFWCFAKFCNGLLATICRTKVASGSVPKETTSSKPDKISSLENGNFWRSGMGRKSEGEEPVGIGWVGSSILGARSSLVGW